jgi:hypothetical protein
MSASAIPERSLLVVALTLQEAREVLHRRGVAVVEVTETRPCDLGRKSGSRPAGPLRVVRERHSAKGAHLTVAASVALAEDGDAGRRRG